jgi:dihydrofolate synthase/folylpolyglutamate synthase
MNYGDSVGSLLALGRELAAPQQARVQKFGLENITVLSADLGNPHCAVPCAHIAGTNGKGSTAAILESILRSAGLRTGLYTSPHLERINERIRLNGEPVSDEIFAAAWTRVHASIESLMASGRLTAHPTYFECVTAMAFLVFAEQRIDFAIYEVGLGGRLDSTNIVTPEVTIITPIDFDHENFLGHSIAEIAAEKAGIIKLGVTVVSSVMRAEARVVVAQKCAEMQAHLVDIDEDWRLQETPSSEGFHRAFATSKDSGAKLIIAPALPGRFQLRNALAAATAARILSESSKFRIEDQDIERGIANVRWPGRLERLSENPAIYLDGAHNPSGARALLEFWQRDLAGRRIILIYGAMRDKAVDEIAGILFPHADEIIITEPRQPRAISAALLFEITGHLASQTPAVVRDPLQAFEHAIEIARDNDAVVVAGSLYLIGEIRSYWRNRKLATSARS